MNNWKCCEKEPPENCRAVVIRRKDINKSVLGTFEYVKATCQFIFLEDYDLALSARNKNYEWRYDDE